MSHPMTQLPNKQAGVALAITLILLLVATLSSLAVMKSGTLQERMTANLNNKAISFMAAEAGGAELLAWIDENGWPDDSNPPPTSGFVSSDQSGQYLLSLQSGSWSDPELAVRIEGRSVSGASVLARTTLDVSVTQPTGGLLGDAPAPISCFGSGCEISAGAGQGADVGFGTISGYDHAIPDLGCSGAGCRITPADDTPIVPAVYLEFPGSSTVGKQGGGRHEPYHGIDENGNAISGADNGVALGPDDYGDDPDTGDSLAPTLESIFGGEDPLTDLRDGNGNPVLPENALSGNSTLQGLLVVDGQAFSMTGNSLFVGLIVVRGCGTVTMSGNPNVYGAIVVDAAGCPPDYDPFAGNGTPAVRYSRAALGGGEAGPGSGPGFAISGWRERL